MKGQLYLFSLMTMVLTGCVETIVMDPGEENLPVAVCCILEEGQGKQTLTLQYVKGKSMAEYIPVEEAKVYIKELDGFKRTVDFHHSKGAMWETYASPFFSFGPTMTYALYVEIPGRAVITAETTIPSDRIIPRVIEYLEDRGTYTEIEKYDDIYFQVDLEDGAQTSPVWIFASKGKHSDNESTKNRYPLLVTDHPYADPINATGLRFSDLEIEGGPTSTDTHMLLTWPVFKEMPQVMPDLPLYDGFIHIDHFDNTPFHLLAGPLKYKASYQDHLDIYFVSEEYDRYLRSVYIKNKLLEKDLTSVFSTDMVYTNINGGVGVFGGISRSSVQFMVN